MLACPHRFLRMCPFEVRQLALREVKLFTGSRVGMRRKAVLNSVPVV